MDYKVIISLYQGFSIGSSWLYEDHITEDIIENIIETNKIPSNDLKMYGDAYLNDEEIDFDIFVNGWLLAIHEWWITWPIRKEESLKYKWFVDPINDEQISAPEALKRFMTDENFKIYDKWRRK